MWENWQATMTGLMQDQGEQEFSDNFPAFDLGDRGG